MFDCLTVTKPTICFYSTTGPPVISEVTVNVWLSHSDKSYNVAFTGPLVFWLSVRWLCMFDCLTVTKPKMLFLQNHWSSGDQWGYCTCLIVSLWQNQQRCFFRTTGPLVIGVVTVDFWLSHSDKTNNVFLQDHWSSDNQWGDCTCLIISQ